MIDLHARIRTKDTAMLRDDSNDGPGRRRTPRNALGEPLEACSIKPMTGFYRDGCCNTGREDIGSHTVCVVMTSAFLDFSKSHGNDLSTPVPQFGFPGLKPGDRWCLCAPRWQEAFEASQAPRVVLRATHEAALPTARSLISNASQWTWRDCAHYEVFRDGLVTSGTRCTVSLVRCGFETKPTRTEQAGDIQLTNKLYFV